MSADGGADSGPGRREVAHRLFAAEFDDATLSYSESDEERAPNYVVTPGGARVNRAFVVGVLTEVESVNEETVRGRVVDPTGPFVTYAGQYQPDEMAFLERADPPAFVALTGKARTFEPDDGDRVYTSLRPESFSEVDADSRDRWVVDAAEATLDRIAVFASALEDDRRGPELRAALEAAGVDESLAAGVPKAIAEYDTGRAYLEALREVAVGALEVVAGERDEAPPLRTLPDDETPTELGPLPDVDVDLASIEVEVEPEDVATEDAVDTDESGAEAAADDVAGDADEADSADAAAAVEADDEAAEAEVAATEGSDDVVEDEDGPDDVEPSTGTDTSAADDAEPVDDDAESADDLGSFDEGPDVDADAPDLDAEDGDEIYELSEEEREEAMEHGVEFETGTEVDEPGEADIDAPESAPEDVADVADAGTDASDTGTDASDTGTDASDTGTATSEADDAAEPAASEATTAESIESEAADGDETDDTTDADEDDGAEADAADVDLEDAVVATMKDLDDDGGAEREAVIERVVEETGADEADVEDAIQDALMAGKCFEPEAGKLQAI